jgi:hypothetical protein
MVAAENNAPWRAHRPFFSVEHGHNQIDPDGMQQRRESRAADIAKRRKNEFAKKWRQRSAQP